MIVGNKIPYEPLVSTSFKKDLKRLKQQGKKVSLLEDVMEKIISKHTLDKKYKDHSLKGNWIGSRDCHIQSDWILIYRLDEKNNAVIFERSGSHQELFNNY